jgi:hypothetical protein
MRWRKTFLIEMYDHLQRLGLSRCAVCGSDDLLPHRYPHVVFISGLPPTVTGVPDPEANVEYLVRIECQRCGYVLMFDAEKFRTGDEPITVTGVTDEQEADIERENPLNS